MADLTAMVREYGSSPAATRPYGSPTPTGGPHPAMQTDVLDEDGNLCAADIGITWADNETFLHGVRVVGTKFSRPTIQRFNNKSLNWPAWFRHSRVAGPGTRRQRPLQLRRAGQTLGRPIRPSIESVGFPLSVSRQFAPPS